MMKIIKPLILFGIGGLIYTLIELVWRGYSHWTMLIVGGLCFLLIGLINEKLSWEMPIYQQCIIGSAIVTAVELFAGIILNVWLKLDIWDYSNMPFNIIGQICLPYSILWAFLSLVAIILDDYLRYWLFGEEKPRYHI